MIRACLGAAGLLAMTLLTASLAHAQVTGNALVIAQSGNRLYTPPADRLGAYTQVDLGYALAHWSLGGRFESDRTSDDTPGSREAQYGLITRRFAQWESGASRVRIGQFGTILGRGLLHRSYELPGVVYDEPGSRTRYAATRDVDGVLAEWGAGPLALRAFSGRPSDGTVSPASEARGALRYAGMLSGAQVEGSLGRSIRAGLAATRYAFGSAPDRHAGSGFASLDLAAETGARTWSLPLAFEYAQGGGSFRDGLRLRRGPETPHAMYASAAIVAGRWSLSAEYKDYDAFRTGLNDPPPLVREHTAALLNRATHVLDADGEEGVQWELQGPLFADLRFVANLARSSGEALTAGGRYEERFGELVWESAARAWTVRAFAARGHDTFDFVGDRHAVGAGITRESGAWGLEAEAEHMRSLRVGAFGFSEPFDDDLWQFAVSRRGWGSAGVTVTRTTDRLDRPSDLFGEPTAPSATFAGFTLAADLPHDSRAEWFAGRRRGGRACVSGSCYEVPSLSGYELRWSARF